MRVELESAESRGEQQEIKRRIKTRLFSDPQVAEKFLDSEIEVLIELGRVIEGKGDIVSLIRRQIEFTNVGVFGDKAKPIDWGKPTAFTDKDLELLDGLRDAADLMSKSQVELATEKITDLPRPLGSRADRGEFGDYSPEVLFTVHLSREAIFNRLKSIQKSHLLQGRSKAVSSLSSDMFNIASSIERSDYNGVFQTLTPMITGRRGSKGLWRL